jgi:hypothetical protein
LRIADPLIRGKTCSEDTQDEKGRTKKTFPPPGLVGHLRGGHGFMAWFSDLKTVTQTCSTEG